MIVAETRCNTVSTFVAEAQRRGCRVHRDRPDAVGRAFVAIHELDSKEIGCDSPARLAS